jgi:hypothetical protein
MLLVSDFNVGVGHSNQVLHNIQNDLRYKQYQGGGSSLPVRGTVVVSQFHTAPCRSYQVLHHFQMTLLAGQQ